MAFNCQRIQLFFGNSGKASEPRIMRMTDYDNPITVMQPDDDLLELTSEFSKLAKENSMLLTINSSNITQWLLNQGETDLESYHRDYVIGADFLQIPLDKMGSLDNQQTNQAQENITEYLPKITVTGLYNSIATHSRPLIVNFMSNILLGYLDGSNLDRKITTTNHPLPTINTVRVR